MNGTHVTVPCDGRETVVAAHEGPAGRVLLTAEDAERALGWVRTPPGWVRTPPGWCRGDPCVPSSAAARAEHKGLLDPVAFAGILDRPLGDRQQA
ncbi:hypothetical protein ACIQV3_27445 [Streptomyces sp. NPDC099050]|uniref:hypothetical protein n=1 Tax=Streptomyces sp. NPDC099050 TaxID=3366100 RepID=UPI0037F6FB34